MLTWKFTPKTILPLALGLALVGVSAANASNIDDGFIKGGAAARIRDYLQEQGYKNVGILRFEVKKGKAAPSMNVGKMNAQVATRLENALIHVNDVKNPIGITRNAGIAVKDPDATWHTDEGRAKLFANKYPLAWGSVPVAVDAFLTGTVEVSADYRETKIIVKVFDKKNTALRAVSTPISVKTDREAVREMGHSYVISKRAFNQVAAKGAVPDSEVDNVVIDTAGMGMGTGMGTETGMGTAVMGGIDKIREYLDFQILVDDVPAVFTDDGMGNQMMDTPAPEQKVVIKVTAKEKLGLLVRVNGINTINKEGSERGPMESSWWVLEPGKEYPIRGFYKDGKVQAFKVVAETEADKSELAADPNRHGVISFEIFKDAAGGGGMGGTGEARIVPRKTSNLLKVTGRSTTLSGLQKNIGNSLKTMAKRSSFILPGAAADTSLETDSFVGVPIGGIDIHYRPK